MEARPAAGGTGVSLASYCLHGLHCLHCLHWPSTDPRTLSLPPEPVGRGRKGKGDQETASLGPGAKLHGLSKPLPASEPLIHLMGRGCDQLGSPETWGSTAVHRPCSLTLSPSPGSSLSNIFSLSIMVLAKKVFLGLRKLTKQKTPQNLQDFDLLFCAQFSQRHFAFRDTI